MFSDEEDVLSRIFTLYFGTGDDAIGLNLLSNKPFGEDGYYILLANPAIAASDVEAAPRDLVFVLDVSGSMSGEKLANRQRMPFAMSWSI